MSDANERRMSWAYQDACADAINPGRCTLMLDRGFGTIAIPHRYAFQNGIRNILMPVPKPFLESFIEGPVPDVRPGEPEIRLLHERCWSRKDCAAGMCREAAMRADDLDACRSDDAAPVIYLLVQNRIADVGAWCQSRQTSPFDMVFAPYGSAFANPKSERGRAMRVLACYARSAVLAVDATVPCDTLLQLSQEWSPIMQPRPHARAASACEAAAMED